MVSFAVLAMAAIVSVLLFGMVARGARFYLLNYRPNERKILADVEKMKQLMAPSLERLVPWTNEEMPLLSLERVDVKRKKQGTTVAQGTFVSIYNEPMVAYTYKKYLSPKENSITYARTSNRAFEFRTKDNKVEIKINNQKIGTLHENGVLYNNRKKMLARINNEDNAMHPVLAHDMKGNMKELGTILSEKNEDQINPRALQMIEPQMNDKEEALFLALALYQLIKKNV
jgi:hypothetical protein